MRILLYTRVLTCISFFFFFHQLSFVSTFETFYRGLWFQNAKGKEHEKTCYQVGNGTLGSKFCGK